VGDTLEIACYDINAVGKSEIPTYGFGSCRRSIRKIYSFEAHGGLESADLDMLMTLDSRRSMLLRIAPDLLACGIGLSLAYFLKWETRDLVWSLWLSSLVLGYLTLLSALAGGSYIGLLMIRSREIELRQSIPVLLNGTAVGLFLFCFFSLHFCGFHAGHSVFLNQFFPIEDLPKEGFGDAFMNPPLLWIMVFRRLLKPYGLFLIAAIIAERNHVFQPLIRALDSGRRGTGPDESGAGGTDKQRNLKGNPLGSAMGRPYINVVRMHLLIFFFAICHALRIDSFLVYAVVCLVYFFPWIEIGKLRAKALDREPQTDSGEYGPSK